MFYALTADHKSNNFALIRSRIRRLPSVHQATLKAIVEHLARVAAHNDKNKMNASNLAIVFAAVLFGEDEQPKAVDLLTVGNLKVSPLETFSSSTHRGLNGIILKGYTHGGPDQQRSHYLR